jgi:hypothetical protein
MSKQVNEILAQGFTKIGEGDGSGFDNTQDVSLKEVDRWLYEQVEHAVYHVPRSEFRYVSHQLYKTMIVQYIENKKKKNLFEYDILGSVFSGDCDTTLCNTIRMALYNIYVNVKAGLEYDKDFKVFSKGDDFTVFYKPYVSDRLIRKAYDLYFINKENVTGEIQTYGLGQILKFLTIGDPNTLSFCSLRALYTDASESKIILVRDYRKFLSITRYARKIKAIQGIKRVAYLQQQAIALRSSYKGIKIFETMAECFDQAAKAYAEYLSKNKGNKYGKTMEHVYQHALKFVDKIVYMSREQFAKDAEVQENYIEKIFYDIGSYKHWFKIQGDYWETMKKLQEKCSYKLTQQEYDYINQQIEDEISLEYFKSSMGLKNF